VAWAFVTTDGAIVHVSKYQPELGTATVVPLYRQPPQPRGWLTQEERNALEWWCEKKGPVAHEQVEAWINSLCNLLARSSPPEVVLPPFKGEMTGGFWALAGYNSAIQVCREALAAAGVAVKEVP
jgi:hypothetical protein